MKSVLIAAVVGTLVATLATPLVRHLAHGVGALDIPSGRRAHLAATPRLGGLAIVGGYWAAVGLCFALGLMAGHAWDMPALWAFLLGGALMAIVGAIDDIKAVGAKVKLLMQVVAASVAWTGGARVLDHLTLPAIGSVEIGPVLSYLATVVWILAFTNAVNLIDGLDGLAGGVVFFACLTNVVVALVSDNILAAVLNAALGGAVLGFLFYNFNPATIFMGDAGSMFLGYTLGAAALLSGRQKESTLVSLLVPLIALGLPLTDTLLAMARRFLAHRSIFSADRQHLHHRLLDLGLTHRRVVLVLYGCSVLLCATALAAAFGRNWQVGAALVGALLTLLGITRFTSHFEFVFLRKTQRARLLTGSAGSLRRVVPELIGVLHHAHSRSAAWAALEQALAASGAVVAARISPVGEAAELWAWQAESASIREEGERVSVDFSVSVFPGARKETLSFVCVCEDGPLPPETEIQLQLIADTLQAAMIRINVDNPRGLLRQVVGEHGQQA
jgi:UDP-GlcNAc:undecaprenyl-phosphate/decaprenyl-phosphate GlcNAc-1-phosphate transferase